LGDEEMSEIKLCKECGVPLMVSREHTWHDNGIITQTADPDHRMIFFESANIDGLFGGVEEILGLSIEKIVLESKRREVKEYVEKMMSPLTLKAAKYVGIGKVIDKLSKNGRAFGYGEIGLVDRRRKNDEGDFVTMSVRNPHSVLFFAGEVLGAWEAIDGREHYVEHEQVADDTFHITCRPGPHPIELQERLQVRHFKYKPGDIVYDRCSTCDVPSGVGKYNWNLEAGTITHPENDRRMAIFSPLGMEAILDDLEAELGDAIPEVVIEAQRRHVRATMDDLSWLGDRERYRRMMGFRGLCNITYFQREEGKVSITMENPCVPLLAVGQTQGMVELAAGADSSAYEFERAPDGSLSVEITLG
jgi:hypothetical protein